MSKYEMYSNSFNEIDDIKGVLTPDEQLLWSGKPKKSAFIINKCLTMLPIALIWLIFDGFFLVMIFTQDEIPREILWFIIPFFAIHLLPVWIWLSNVLTASKRWRCTEYAYTNLRVIIKTGLIGVDFVSIYYKEIHNVQLKVGVADKLLGVGDIFFETGAKKPQAFLDIEDAYNLYPKLQKTVIDIQTDVHYPNDLRPTTNSGYKTRYDDDNL